MPELPEVEVIRRELKPQLIGKIFDRPRLFMPSTIAYPAPEDFLASLTGLVITDVSRRGKYLVIYLNQGFLAVHLRMTGNLFYVSPGDLPRMDHYLRLAMPFTDGSALHYSDMRRFGRLWLVKDQFELQGMVFKNVGPDIFEELSRDQFRRLLRQKQRRSLKALLLDQQGTSGMGNIYTDECLHLCRLHPESPAGSLKPAEADQLYNAIRKVLTAGIQHGGTSFRDYRNTRGALGAFQSKLTVYGRKGERCQCGELIVKTIVAGRGTYYCPRCQVKKVIGKP